MDKVVFIIKSDGDSEWVIGSKIEIDRFGPLIDVSFHRNLLTIPLGEILIPTVPPIPIIPFVGMSVKIEAVNTGSEISSIDFSYRIKGEWGFVATRNNGLPLYNLEVINEITEHKYEVVIDGKVIPCTKTISAGDVFSFGIAIGEASYWLPKFQFNAEIGVKDQLITGGRCSCSQEAGKCDVHHLAEAFLEVSGSFSLGMFSLGKKILSYDQRNPPIVDICLGPDPDLKCGFCKNEFCLNKYCCHYGSKYVCCDSKETCCKYRNTCCSVDEKCMLFGDIACCPKERACSKCCPEGNWCAKTAGGCCPNNRLYECNSISGVVCCDRFCTESGKACVQPFNP